jgi:nucleoside 2-deoxyribosyltransferase
MKKVYIAGPFFTKGEIMLGEEVYTALHDAGFSVYSPCREDVIHGHESSAKERMDCFKTNLRGIDGADNVVALLDDEDPTTMWEIGYAYSKGVAIYGFSTDLRQKLPNTILLSCIGVYGTVPGLIQAIKND